MLVHDRNRVSVQGEAPPYGLRNNWPVQGSADPPKRFRLAHWVALGMVPWGIAPASIAAAYSRTTGHPPARDPSRRACRAYSIDELRLALAELASRPPEPPPQRLADPLALIWAAAIERIDLPATRSLLSQKVRLVSLSRTYGGELRAVLVVSPDCWGTVCSSRGLAAAALTQTLARPVSLQLQGVGQ